MKFHWQVGANTLCSAAVQETVKVPGEFKMTAISPVQLLEGSASQRLKHRHLLNFCNRMMRDLLQDMSISSGQLDSIPPL
jgi:hypothetical protein